jgi:hypothetical protein
MIEQHFRSYGSIVLSALLLISMIGVVERVRVRSADTSLVVCSALSKLSGISLGTAALMSCGMWWASVWVTLSCTPVDWHEYLDIVAPFLSSFFEYTVINNWESPLLSRIHDHICPSFLLVDESPTRVAIVFIFIVARLAVFSWHVLSGATIALVSALVRLILPRAVTLPTALWYAVAMLLVAVALLVHPFVALATSAVVVALEQIAVYSSTRTTRCALLSIVLELHIHAMLLSLPMFIVWLQDVGFYHAWWQSDVLHNIATSEDALGTLVWPARVHNPPTDARHWLKHWCIATILLQIVAVLLIAVSASVAAIKCDAKRRLVLSMPIFYVWKLLMILLIITYATILPPLCRINWYLGAMLVALSMLLATASTTTPTTTPPEEQSERAAKNQQKSKKE